MQGKFTERLIRCLRINEKLRRYFNNYYLLLENRGIHLTLMVLFDISGSLWGRGLISLIGQKPVSGKSNWPIAFYCRRIKQELKLSRSKKLLREERKQWNIFLIVWLMLNLRSAFNCRSITIEYFFFVVGHRCKSLIERSAFRNPGISTEFFCLVFIY